MLTCSDQVLGRVAVTLQEWDAVLVDINYILYIGWVYTIVLEDLYILTYFSETCLTMASLYIQLHMSASSRENVQATLAL